MPGGHLNTVLTHIRQWAGAPAAGEPGDGRLLERFLARRDQAAFAEIVQRHGAMVQGVCRRVLRDAHEADDAFQATFLVLVRKAKSIVRQESLGSWLYGVAYRVSLRARAQADRRRAQSPEVDDVIAPEACAGNTDHDLRPVLDEEINRLPERFRQPVVLCYFEGKPYEEAARQLGWPAGTVASRLARAREVLRKRLTRRGVALASSFPAALLADQRVSAQLLENTVRAAYHYAAGPAAAAGNIPAPVAALAEGTVHAMFVHKLKIAAV
ncbi:MAG: RNA polymerase sigma factor [Gemmataceae bacterium]|nr:RNA polymerase sigma factor [Gemmataceae bacterium]